MSLVFTSKVPKQSREAVENLFFLNPRQYRVRNNIVDALKQFGHPRLEEKDDSIYLCVGDKDAQTLFVFDDSTYGGDPVGAVVFLRDSPTEVVIVHIAVHPDYALHGRRARLGVGMALVDKVKEIASRIVGVEKIVFFYRPEVVIRL